MSKDIRVRHNLKGLNKLMSSAPFQAEVNAAAARLAAAAGEKFQVHPKTHSTTGRAFVEPKKGESLTHKDRVALLSAVSRQG